MQNQKCYRPTQRFLGLEENYFSNKWSKEFHAHLATLLRRNVAIIATSGECAKHHDGKQKELLRRVFFLKAEHCYLSST
ncbi:hypothetical protein BGX16_1460 [Hallerella succinigenes]|uniref:Uncharacterized protein n=1 Tax=Hallerella succinigenes TaxID=1896222 RepID=A0A2M9A767_9BACT|nr:hypothetical protein BGX16_1460 [Hallerella succinigenes]